MDIYLVAFEVPLQLTLPGLTELSHMLVRLHISYGPALPRCLDTMASLKVHVSPYSNPYRD